MKNIKLTLPQIEKAFGKFEYIDIIDGSVKITDNWITLNIDVINMPLVGRVECNKKITPILTKIFDEAQIIQSIKPIIDVKDFRSQGGCFVPRHILWNKDKPLSNHSWGIAIDLNVNTNGYGEKPTQTPELVYLFKKYGFVWGGEWYKTNADGTLNYATSDGMHFEVGTDFCSQNNINIEL